MSWRRSWSIVRHEFRHIADDPGSVVWLVIMPLLMMALMKPLFALSLEAEGYSTASGAEQAVPGMAAMFATFSASYAGFGFFREYGWHTWDRLRASPATTTDIMVGKVSPVFLVAMGQLVGLFALGVWLLGLVISGSLVALLLVVVTFSVSMVAFGMAIMSLSRTSLQLNTLSNLIGMVFAGVGGALVPLTVLPAWVQTMARFTPTYWAMEGFLDVILDNATTSEVIIPSAVLLAFGAGFSAIAAYRFRFEESKVYYG